MGSRCVKFGVIALSHTGHWKFNMAPHGKELSEVLKKRMVALHKDGLGYELQHGGQDHTAVYQDRFHSEQASTWSSYPEVIFGK